MADYQELANGYFAEYQQQDMEVYERELARWESVEDTIRGMPLAEKAGYADYVTKKMCENHRDIALQHTRNEVIPKLSQMDPATLNSCAIGNVAAHLMLLPESERTYYNDLITGGRSWCTVM